VTDSREPTITRTQLVIGVACVLCYAVGYPWAIIGGSAAGWVLVTVGGFLLIAECVVTLRRFNRGKSRP
jgi:hypothetical protein